MIIEPPDAAEETVASIDLEDSLDSERDKIVRWRLEQLLAAGYDGGSALILAMDSSIDLHLAVSLLASGCPTETALRILF